MRAAVLELVYHEADPVVHLALSKCSKVFVCLYTLVCVLEEERLERERERKCVCDCRRMSTVTQRRCVSVSWVPSVSSHHHAQKLTCCCCTHFFFERHDDDAVLLPAKKRKTF